MIWAQSIWKGVIEVEPRRVLVAPQIIEEVAAEHGVTPKEMVSEARHRTVAYARFDAMSRIRALKASDGSPRFSLCQVGRMFGGRDHTTVLNGLKRWSEVQAAKREAEAA